MTHLKRKLMMTLALLLTAATGAWAESKPIGLNVEYEAGDVITTNSTGDVYIWWGIYSTGGDPQEWVIKISSSITPTISELGIVESSGSIKLATDYAVYDMNGNIAANSYSIQCQGEVTGTTLEKVYVASGSGTLTDPYVFAPGPAAPAATPFPITWNATTPNTASIEAMPAGNVTVKVKYFPQAEFAKSTGETPVALAPTAIADVPATTDGPIVNPGTVANIGSTETAQGTVMYYVSTTPMTDAQLQALDADKWSADVPTAESLAEGQAYVYYYIKGAEPATIAERTDANTCSDGDILAANVVNVTLAAAPLWNAEFDLTNAPEEDKAPGVWSTDIPEGGVVKGTPVKVTYTGTKKIIGVKAEKKSAFITLDNTTTAWTAGKYAVPAGGLTYSAAITVSGDVTLVLTDGETLTLNKGISLAEGATLTVEGNGTMNINGTNNSTASTVAGTGMLVLTSGTLNAKGGNGDGLIITDSWLDNENNIGVSGGVAINGNVTVNGGTVTATGGNGGILDTSQIAGGYNNHGGNGGAAISGNVTVNAGGWTATNGSNGTYTPGGDDNGCSAGTGGKAVAGTVTDNR
jgi:uncharacterized protein (DUF2147 family)